MPYRVYRECKISGIIEWLETDHDLTLAEANCVILDLVEEYGRNGFTFYIWKRKDKRK